MNKRKRQVARVLAAMTFVCALASGVDIYSVESQTKSQPKPDLSGSWLLDQKKSNDSGLTTRPDLPIRIAHRDPDFRVTRPSEWNGQILERSFTFYTDGRGETNQATSGLTTSPSAAQAEKLKARVLLNRKRSGVATRLLRGCRFR